MSGTPDILVAMAKLSLVAENINIEEFMYHDVVAAIELSCVIVDDTYTESFEDSRELVRYGSTFSGLVLVELLKLVFAGAEVVPFAMLVGVFMLPLLVDDGRIKESKELLDVGAELVVIVELSAVVVKELVEMEELWIEDEFEGCIIVAERRGELLL